MKKRGFTLIELLVVIAIIGILAVLIFLALERSRAAARDSQRKAFARDLTTAEALYYDSHKRYGGIGLLNSDELIDKWPDVCPNGDDPNADCTQSDTASRNAWGNALDVPSNHKSFCITVSLERTDDYFMCDENGCEDSRVASCD